MASLTTRLLVGAAIIAGAGCGLGSEEDEADLRRAEVRWTRSGVQDYQIVVQNLCFCGYTRPVRLTYRFGSVVSRVDAETGEPVPPYANNVRDVAGLFALIREAIDGDAHRLEVSYDGTYGYPRFIDIDYVGNAADDELQVRTSEFQPLR